MIRNFVFDRKPTYYIFICSLSNTKTEYLFLLLQVSNFSISYGEIFYYDVERLFLANQTSVKSVQYVFKCCHRTWGPGVLWQKIWSVGCYLHFLERIVRAGVPGALLQFLLFSSNNYRTASWWANLYWLQFAGDANYSS